ncbi:MAG TPA: hypothetical protein VID04_01230 [Methylomirabilota bacterium]|jgi:hypothetical protein
MHLWAQIVVVVCVVALTVVLVPTVLVLRRAAERLEGVLALAERELQPLAEQLQALIVDLRGMSGEVREELERLGTLAERASELSDGLGRVLAAVSGLTRAGQLVGVAAGLKTGLDMFLHRLRKDRGENNE